MIERREHLRFAFEAREAIRVSGEYLWEDLQRDVAREFRIPRAIDLAMPPSPTLAAIS